MKYHSMTRRMVPGGISTLALTTSTGLAKAANSSAIFVYRNPDSRTF